MESFLGALGTVIAVFVMLRASERKLETKIDALDDKFDRKFEALDDKLDRKFDLLIVELLQATRRAHPPAEAG